MSFDYKKVLIVLGVTIAVVLSFIVGSNTAEKDSILSKGHLSETIPVSIGHTILNVFVADTDYFRRLGLGGRKSILENEGMLFVFDKSALHSFWMKDMLFAIDIIWLDESKRVVFIEKNVFPDSYPKNFVPTVPAKYVLETNSGFSDKNGVLIGDSVNF